MQKKIRAGIVFRAAGGGRAGRRPPIEDAALIFTSCRHRQSIKTIWEYQVVATTPLENVKSPMQPAKITIIKTSHLGHGVLPPRRENQKYLQLVRVTHPSSTLRTLIFPRAVFRFQKNDCYEQDPNILDL